MDDNKQLTRGAGILMAISSLPSSYGIGTLGAAAYSFVDMLVDLKQRYWQILPIGPTSFGNSPYQALSAFAGNSYLIDLDDLSNQGLLTQKEIRSFEWGSNDGDIDYSTMYHNRTQVLKIAYSRFAPDKADYNKFLEVNSYWLDDYAMYRALKEYHGDREWTSWKEEYRDRNPQAIKDISRELADNIDFYKFCQYEFDMQWRKLIEYANSRGIQIIGDIPLYVAADSADVWAHRKSFQLNEDGTAKLVSAVPADAFSSTGQIWGNPIYDWDAMCSDGYTWWKARVSQASKLYNVVRLDHFIGVVKYYAVNANSSNTANGKWHKGPGRKFLDAITPSFGTAQIIIDDAGPKTVVPGVKKLVEKSGLASCRIMLLGWDADTDSENLPHNYATNNQVVYTTTHDTETATGYVNDRTDAELEYICDYMGVSDKDRLPDAMIRLAYGCSANVAIISMQDLLGLGNEARMNAPSTVGGNWQWRLSQNNLSKERCDWIRKLAYTYRR